MKLSFQMLKNLLRKSKEEEETPQTERKEEKPVLVREPVRKSITERWEKRPKIIFVGSGKGGVGKSFVSSNLAYILSAHTKSKVFAVDLDLDNTTLSMVLPPATVMSNLQRNLATRGIDYLNLSDILIEGIIGKKAILNIPLKLISCGGTQINTRIRIIPAYHELKKKSQLILLREIDVLRLREGLQVLFDYLRSKDAVAILDGKQKSNLGINYDPLYKVAKEQADVVLIVTEPPYLSFSTITAPYKDIINKTIIVVNKAEMSFLSHLRVLVSDAKRYGVPVFIVPYSKEDGEIYSKKLEPPAAMLSRKTALYVGAIARYLNLIEDCSTRCCEEYDKLLELHLRLFKG